MPQPQYPKKGIFSYLLPFVFIFALIGIGFYQVVYQTSLSDFQRIFQSPSVDKNRKVLVVSIDGEVQINPWSESRWINLDKQTSIQPGDEIRTLKNSQLVLRFFEDSELRLNNSTSIKLSSLESNQLSGNHISVELSSGQVWARIQAGNTPNADFIINTPHQLIRANQAVALHTQVNPEITRIIGGELTVNLSETTSIGKKPLGRLKLSGGEEMIIDDLVIDQVKSGDLDILSSFTDNFRDSGWYDWNMKREKTLGSIVDLTSQEVPKEPELEQLEKGLVIVTTPQDGENVGPQVLMSGSYDKDKISAIQVNGEEATLGLNGDWEIGLSVTPEKNIFRVTATEKETETIKEHSKILLRLDTEGPVIGKINKPEVDENNNGELTGDTLELIGEIGEDAQRVCVIFNDDDTPYCLKQFTPGDKIFRYLGGVKYGNVVSGKNKYEIKAYDSLGNESKKIIYLFKGIPKPEEALNEEGNQEETNSNEDSTNSEVSNNSNDEEIPRPVITTPDNSIRIETSEKSIKISGTVSTRTVSLYANDKKVSYTPGASTFSFTYPLTEGENNISLQAGDSKGKRSKSTLLRVLSLEALNDSETEESS